MRSRGKVARGVFVYAKVRSKEPEFWKKRYWHARRMAPLPIVIDPAIYAQSAMLFAGAPKDPMEIGITCYELSDDLGDQLSLFGDQMAREQHITDAIDEINRRFGDRMIHSADTLGTGEFVKQKIPFGSTRFL